MRSLVDYVTSMRCFVQDLRRALTGGDCTLETLTASLVFRFNFFSCIDKISPNTLSLPASAYLRPLADWLYASAERRIIALMRKTSGICGGPPATGTERRIIAVVWLRLVGSAQASRAQEDSHDSPINPSNLLARLFSLAPLA